ncbi:MAG TPA: trypsin-like peptidase domain-containing protein [Pirellulaceae bacterium]|nr:trypsin-like peptidase domain-containing protein [Pirellulaceae bacterium]
MRWFAIFAMVFVGMALETCRADEIAIRPAVVKIWASKNSLNLSSPWKRGERVEESGSGIWLGNNRILTNTHVVSYATQVSVQPHESSERIAADVVVASHEMDLAILKLDDPGAFADVEPLKFADALPKLRTSVQVYGYPDGGNSMSVTEGVVSRIEYQTYAYGTKGLRIQVDAAVNPGNSGGPAVADGEVIGITFQKRSLANNIGYLIPSEEVQTFLNDVEDGRYDGKAMLRLTYQRLLNRGLRDSLNLDSEVTGIWVREVFSEDENYPLQVGDVLTHVGPHAIDNSGVVRLVDDLQFEFQYFVSQLVDGGVAPLTVFRDGQAKQLKVPLGPPARQLFRPLKGDLPSYFVYGPLVFMEGTADYFNALEASLLSSDARVRVNAIAAMRVLANRHSPLVLRRFDEPAFEGEQPVMLTSSLPHRILLGYGNPATNILKSVNGIPINSMRQLVEALRRLNDTYVRFEFADDGAETMVFAREAIEATTEDILADNGIPRRASPDLLEVWDATGAER